MERSAFVFCTILLSSVCTDDLRFEILMPKVSPQENEEYLCTSKRLPNFTTYATRFTALADEEKVHHLLVYGCEEVPSQEPYWKCLHQYPCGKGKRKLLFAWAKNAPAFQLPQHVGFKLSPSFGMKHIAVQLHYTGLQNDGKPDESGIAIHLTTTPMKFVAGIYLFSTSNFMIPPNITGYHVDMQCEFKGRPIIPFAFRTHSHDRGRVISAYQVRDGEEHLIGVGDPQKPQAFYVIPTDTRSIIHETDTLMARCTFDSKSSKAIFPGPLSSNEMCNFYMMYYHVDSAREELLSGCHERRSDVQFPGTDVEQVAKNSSTTQTVYELPSRPITSSPTSIVNRRSTERIHSSIQPISPLDVLLLKHNWTISNMAKRTIRHVYSVAVDNEGFITLLHHSLKNIDEPLKPLQPIAENPIMILDSSGKNIQANAGANMFYFPLSLSIDGEGSFFITDIVLHQVFKCDLKDGILSPVFVLGEKMIAGDDDEHFCKPTDVLVMATGDFFVADGLCNDRLKKFDRHGDRVKVFRDGHLKSPFSLTFDQTSLYVGHLNGISVFTIEGGFVRSFTVDSFAGNHFQLIYSRLQDCLYALGKGGLVLNKTDGVTMNRWIHGTKENIPFAISGSKLYLADTVPDKLRLYELLQPHEELLTDTNDTYLIDDMALMPAITVVVILATPLFLLATFAIIQNVRTRRQRQRMIRLRRLPSHENVFFGCCATPKYYYGVDRTFDGLMNNNSEQEEDLMTRKA